MLPCKDHGLRGNKPGGYHQGRLGGRLYYVHRLAYAEAHNLVINGVPPLLRHTCDNPRCVEASHLIPGTHQDNANDRVLRGRSAKEVPSRRLLTPEQEDSIYELRKDKKTYDRKNSRRQLAARFGVSTTAIDGALRRAARRRT